MRLVARFNDKRMVGGLVDILKNAGLDRKDMIINDLAEEERLKSAFESAHEVSLVSTASESLTDDATFGQSVPGLAGKSGVIVAVEIPQEEKQKVHAIMKDAGAVEIVED